MKHNLKVFLIALIIGMVASYIFCYKFDNTIISKALESKATYFYVGSYNSLNEATTKKANYKNAIIYNDNGIYKIVIGIYSKKESIELMSSYFLDLLIKTSEKSYYDNINNSLLKLFNEYIS